MCRSFRCCSFRFYSRCCHTFCAEFSDSSSRVRPRSRTVSFRVLLPMAIVAIAQSAPISAAQPLVQPVSQATQLRTDSAEVAKRARDLQANFERRRRHMLPRFYIGTADPGLILGRSCEWHANLSDYVVPEEGEDIVRARAGLLRDLERASDAVPGDGWIVGQRIRYLVEGHDTSAV